MMRKSSVLISRGVFDWGLGGGIVSDGVEGCAMRKYLS